MDEVKTQIKVVVRDDLLSWQKLNVTAFLMGGIGATGACGATYCDKDGKEYLPIIKQPVIIHKADEKEIKELFKKVNTREDFKVAIYTKELFKTNNDIDNRGEVARFATEDLDIVGFALIGPKNPIDKIFKKVKLHD